MLDMFYVCFLVFECIYYYVLYVYLVCLLMLVGCVGWIYMLFDDDVMCVVVVYLIGEYDFLLFWLLEC